MIEDKIHEKWAVIDKLRSYPGIVHKNMVEIHTCTLNKDLISRCEQQVEDMLRQVFSGIASTVKKLEKDIQDEKTFFSNLDNIKNKDDFEAWSDLKNYEEKLFDFIYNKKRDYTEKFNRVKNH